MAELEPDTSPDAVLEGCDALDGCTCDEMVAALREVTLLDDDGNECDACEGVTHGSDGG